MRAPFQRADEMVAVRLEASEREALSVIPDLLAGAGDAGGRLDYRAHPDDPGAEQRYQELVADSLDQARLEDRSAFREALASDEITVEEAEAMMRVIGEARIVLAAQLGIEEDGWEEEADPRSDPQMALLAYLGYLQDVLVGTVG